MLSFHIINDGQAVQVCCDHEGMALLLNKLAALVRDPDHIHLRGPSSGGNELSEHSPFGEAAVSEVIIDFSPDYPSPQAT